MIPRRMKRIPRRYGHWKNCAESCWKKEAWFLSLKSLSTLHRPLSYVSNYFSDIRKRLLSEHDFLPPEFSVSLWSPLMAELQSNHPAFPRVLIGCIVKELLQVNSDETCRSSTSDPHYLACLSRWAFWSAQKNWPLSSTASETDLRQDALVSLITALGPTASPQSAGEKA